MNPWESSALDYRFTDQDNNNNNNNNNQARHTDETAPGTSDNLIYPGLYCPSGLDVMSVLLRVFSRPSPTVDLGPVDSSVALVVCDLALRDAPIVYASDGFLSLTGYRMDEVRGRNCRLLQAPGGMLTPPPQQHWLSARSKFSDGGLVLRGVREAVAANREHQAEIVNFKKGGEMFVNILTIIPITWGDGGDFRYSVGFQCQKE